MKPCLLIYISRCQINVYNYTNRFPKYIWNNWINTFETKKYLMVKLCLDNHNITKSVSAANPSIANAKSKFDCTINIPRYGVIAILDTHRKFGIVYMFSLCKKEHILHLH